MGQPIETTLKESRPTFSWLPFPLSDSVVGYVPARLASTGIGENRMEYFACIFNFGAARQVVSFKLLTSYTTGHLLDLQRG